MSIETMKFRGRHVPKAALSVLITGSLALILLAVMITVSAVSHKTADIHGIAAITAAVLSLTGFILSAVSCSERDIYTAVPIAGMIVNGISLLSYIIVYVLGLLA